MIGKTVSHYRILEKLGEGGMGVVYKAEDIKLGRSVALKFLPTDLTRSPEAKERFIQEAKAASSLDHNNICTIHEIEETDDGQVFIAMACYDGETLKNRIERGPLRVEDAVGVAIRIGEGLARAHEASIVHRDVKPANIMVTKRGDVKVLDFGLAKLAGQARLTRSGLTIGTVAYMSPEQVQGEEVDGRTDVWSLGVVLYEMLAGWLPFKGEHEAALLYSIVHEEPKELSLLRHDVAAPLSALVSGALRKDREARYQTVREVVDELRRLSTLGTALDAPSPRMEKSIAVLPFENLSPDPGQEYFSDGLTEEVISDLSNVRALRVISRSSAMTFKGTKRKVPEIARELNVRYVLEGSVRKSGNSLRITAQLIDAANDAHLWAEKYSGTLDDVFDVQEKVSRSIVEALKLKLTPEESRKIAERPIDNVAAYQCFLRANAEVWQFTESSVDRARLHLEKGIEILGDNALLYSAMAFVYWQYANIGVGQEEHIAKAEEYARKALALDPDSASAHLAVGILNMAFRGNWREAKLQLERALAASPNSPRVLTLLIGLLTMSLGKPAAALPLIERFREINPLDPWNHWLRGRLYYFDGEYGLAVEEMRRHHESDAANAIVRFFYAWTLTYEKKLDEAFSVIDEGVRTNPENVATKFGLLLKCGLLKEREKAMRQMTADFQKTCRRDGQWSYFVAVPLALLDAREEAMAWLENAVNRGFINYPELARNPHLNNLRGEAQFKRLMERVRDEWEHVEA